MISNEIKSLESVIGSMNRCFSEEETFSELNRYFSDKGFGELCYVTPETASQPYCLMESGMSAEWMHRYRSLNLAEHDPIPRVAFRIGRPVTAGEAIKSAHGLSADERAFIEAFTAAGMTSALLLPTFGPLGRPALVGVGGAASEEALDATDLSMAAAVAQQAHIRMELLRKEDIAPRLSAKERQIVKLMARGKSNSEIGALLATAPATVATHVKRIYSKLGVNDRVNCVSKAMAGYFI